MSRLSREEVQELVHRHKRTRSQGGASLDDIRGDMLVDMITELGRMVRAYSGEPRQTRELLEALVIAETEGVTSDAIADVLGELRTKLEAA